MTNIKRQGLSLLTALILVISLLALLPEGALKAHALSGSGTADDPFIVMTYDELREKANDFSLRSDIYIKLGANIKSFDNISQNEISISSSTPVNVHIDLAGHQLDRQSSSADNSLFYIREKATLIMDDSVGNAFVTMTLLTTSDARNPRYIFTVMNGGTLIINDGEYHTNHHPSDSIFKISDGNLILNGGDFYSSNGAASYYDTAKALQSWGSDSKVVFNGGKFYSDNEKSGVQIKFYDDPKNLEINYLEMVDNSTDHARFVLDSTHIFDCIPENAVVMEDDKILSRSEYSSSLIYAWDRILIYTKKAITGMRWEGTKLYWDKYPLASKYGLQIEKPLPGGGYTAVANTATTDTEFDFGMFFENNGVGKYRITVGAETDDGILLSLVTHSNTIEYDPRETVSEISLAVTEPKDGVTITKAIPSSTGEKRYTVTKSLWFKGTSTSGAAMESTEKFVEGQTYTLYCEVRTTSGYKFVSPSATVNGKTAATVNYSGNGIVSVKQTFTAPLNVKTVNVTVTAPTAGAKPSVGDAEVTGAGAAIAPVNVKQNGSTVKLENTVSWFLGDEALDVATSTFEAGKTYTAAVYLKALDGYNIVNNDIKVYINGKQAELDPASLLSLILHGTVIYKAEFECEASGQHLVGDMNNDGKISADDAIIVARYAAGYGDYKTRYSADIADMNRDGTVSADDAIIIARYSAGYGDYKTRYTNYV